MSLALITALGINVAGNSSALAAAGHICGPFPKVSWWVNDPAKILKLVENRYKGDWDIYIASWSRYPSSLELSLDNGESRPIKSQGKTLRGLHWRFMPLW